MARSPPRVSVEPDTIYVRDGDVWTSAGVTAGMDLALALVEDDLGRRRLSGTIPPRVLTAPAPGKGRDVMRTGILVFENAEELDFVGPWEVLTTAKMMGKDDEVLLVAERPGPLRCAKGMRVIPDATLEDAPPLDVVLVPGGLGTRTEVDNPVVIEWLRRTAPSCRWVTSVCTGALLLDEAGLTRGKRITTHWAFVSTLRERGNATVLDDVRYVRDGNLVTAAGVSAGIDMALWLTGEIHGIDFARSVQRYIEYDPAPPYAAET